MAKRCIFLTTYYEKFLSQHYSQNMRLAESSHAEQLSSLIETAFGDSDFYSSGLAAQGWDCKDIIMNSAALQVAWGREHASIKQGLDSVLEQVAYMKPDVVYLHDLNMPQDFIQALKPITKLLVGQIAYTPGPSVPLYAFDIIVSSIHDFVDNFRSAGITAYYQPLAFSPRSLDGVTVLDWSARPVSCSFVGGLDGFTPEILELMESLVTQCGMKAWGYGVEHLAASSPLRSAWQGETWGKDMFGVLANSRITINRHRAFAGNSANNMRLYEATGSGALLLTEYKDNLNDIFIVGKEVVAYRSPAECLELVHYYQANPEEAAAIAQAGQKRTLDEHSYKARMRQTHLFLSRQLRYRLQKPVLQKLASLPSQEDVQELGRDDITSNMLCAWQDRSIPLRQRAVNIPAFDALYSGKPVRIFTALLELLRHLIHPDTSILEIGCASGYLVEQMEYLLKKTLSYTGVDYSDALIEMAKDYNPEHTFRVADGADLPFDDKSFDIVISGCVLLHVPNYAEHIAESCRVASKYLVLHRTPYYMDGPTKTFRKLAYGVEVMEQCFSRQELHEIVSRHGFRFVSGQCIDKGINSVHMSELFVRS